jgi:KH domain-containing RNA-binding signal transduction-associated protein 3
MQKRHYALSFVLFQFNFVGKLLGPKGNSLKRLQEDTMTKMAILGRGSMRDKHKVRNSSDMEIRSLVPLLHSPTP